MCTWPVHILRAGGFQYKQPCGLTDVYKAHYSGSFCWSKSIKRCRAICSRLTGIFVGTSDCLFLGDASKVGDFRSLLPCTDTPRWGSCHLIPLLPAVFFTFIFYWKQLSRLLLLLFLFLCLLFLFWVRRMDIRTTTTDFHTTHSSSLARQQNHAALKNTTTTTTTGCVWCVYM